jgi:hypothetical protein
MKYAIIALVLLITPAQAYPWTRSRQFMMCSSVEHMLSNCDESRVNKTVCSWINPEGHAKGYSEMIMQGWLSQKKFEAVCHRVCAGQLTVPDALSRFCPPDWRKHLT